MSFENEIDQHNTTVELINFTTHAHEAKDVSQIKMSDKLALKMLKDEADYLLFNIIYAFERTQKNQNKAVTKSIALSLLSLCTYTSIPKKSNMTLCSMILKRSTRKVVFCKESMIDGKSPMSEINIDQLLNKNLYKYINCN